MVVAELDLEGHLSGAGRSWPGRSEAVPIYP